MVKEGSKKNSYGQFEVVDTASAFDVGSSNLDAALMEHFATEFNAKHLPDGGHVLDHPKAVAKLRKQVRALASIASLSSLVTPHVLHARI